MMATKIKSMPIMPDFERQLKQYGPDRVDLQNPVASDTTTQTITTAPKVKIPFFIVEYFQNNDCKYDFTFKTMDGQRTVIFSKKNQ